MGRITVFTSDDIISKQVKTKLDLYGLPYSEISFNENPNKYSDVQALTKRVSVPQVFFNTRYIGGKEETLDEIRLWEEECTNSADRICQKYEKCIAECSLLDDEEFKVLSEPQPDPAKKSTYRTSCSKNYNIGIPLPIKAIPLPDGTLLEAIDLIERLRNSLPFADIKHRGSIYLKCITGKSVVEQFEKSLQLTQNQAVAFGQSLVEAKILRCVGGSPVVEEEETFKNSKSCVCRLQCENTPDILNSYCIWEATTTTKTKTTTTTKDEINSQSHRRLCHLVVSNLDELLNEIELSSMDKNGKVDHQASRRSRLYTKFEVAICELQNVQMDDMDHDNVLAFALNLYRLMIRYALIKIGIPADDNEFIALLKVAKFNVGGYIFSLQDWVDGILRGNRRTRFSKNYPFKDDDDPRKKFALKDQKKFSVTDLDPRIHFAINIGAWLGSSTSLPFRTFTADNIDNELDIAACVFFEDCKTFRICMNGCTKSLKLYLSKRIMWYLSDFGRSNYDIYIIAKAYVRGWKKLDLQSAVAGLDHSTFNNNNKGGGCEISVKLASIESNCTYNATNCISFNEESLKTKIKGVKAMVSLRFQPSKMHKRELTRLSTLHRLDILDTLPDERLDRITAMAKDVFNVQIVLVSLVDENRVWFKSKQWFCSASSVPECSEADRDVAFCGHAIHVGEGEILNIGDTIKDDRFADNPLVTGDFGIRFYAGCPLSVHVDDIDNDEDTTTTKTTTTSISSSSSVVNIGTLCLIDQKPRELTQEEIDQLIDFANKARDEIERLKKKKNPQQNDDGGINNGTQSKTHSSSYTSKIQIPDLLTLSPTRS